jgi:hypothetical protein
LPSPFSSPGEALLQFILDNFSSQVCTPVAPGSPLFAPSPVYIAVSRDDLQPISSSSIRSMLQFWIGSKFESLDVFEVGHCVFCFNVASARIASFIVSLGGIRHGRLLALFFDFSPLVDPVNPGPNPIGPLPPLMNSVTPPSVLPATADQAHGLTLVGPQASVPSATLASGVAGAAATDRHQDAHSVPFLAKKRRSPLDTSQTYL